MMFGVTYGLDVGAGDETLFVEEVDEVVFEELLVLEVELLFAEEELELLLEVPLDELLDVLLDELLELEPLFDEPIPGKPLLELEEVDGFGVTFGNTALLLELEPEFLGEAELLGVEDVFELPFT